MALRVHIVIDSIDCDAWAERGFVMALMVLVGKPPNAGRMGPK